MKKNMVKETKAELKKVIWPNAKDVSNGTAVVVAMSAIVGAFIFVADFGSSWLIRLILEKIPT